MPKWLEAIFPQLTLARLIAYAVAAAALIALVLFCFFTVKGWRDDAAKLPMVQAQLKQALADYADLDKSLTGKMGNIAAGIIAERARRDGVGNQLDASQASITAQINDFLKRYSNARSHDPLCNEPQSLRDGLLYTWPLYVPAQPSAAGGDGQGGQPAGTPVAPGAAAAVPGRQRSEIGGADVGVPAAARSGGSLHGGRSVVAAGEAGSGAADGNQPAVPAEGVGLAQPGWFARVGARVSTALKVIGALLVQTAQDDKGNA